MPSFEEQIAELAASFNAGKYPRALMQARSLYGAQTQELTRAIAQWWLARSFVTAGEFEQALLHALQARAVFKANNNPLMQARAEVVCVRAFWRLGEMEQAFAMGHSVVVYARSQADLALMSEATRIIGLVYSDSGQHEEAHEHVGKALTFAEACNDPVMLAEAINSVGSVLFEEAQAMEPSHERNMRMAMAEARFSKSYAIAEAVPHQPSMSTSLGNMGAALIERGEYAQAYEVCKRANALTLAGAVRTNAAYDDINLAECEWLLGQRPKAVESMQKALAQAERMSMKRVMRYAHSMLAKWFGELGDSLSSDKHANRAAQMATEVKREVQLRKERIAQILEAARVNGDVAVANHAPPTFQNTPY